MELHLGNGTLQFAAEAQDRASLWNWVRRLFAEAESTKAPAVRWLDEGLGTKPPGISVAEFFELHARLNYLVKQYPSVALCQYDIDRLEVSDVFSAIAVHRHLLVEGTLVRDNPFYLPPEKFLSMASKDRERDLRHAYREVGFDLDRLLSTLASYGKLQHPASAGV